MNNFRFWRKMIRPEQAALAGLGAVAILMLTNLNISLSTTIALGSSIFFNVIGASLFHYGAAKKIYARKHWDRVDVQKPIQLVSFGLSIFSLSILVSLLWLSNDITIILLLNAILISIYARVLSKFWFSKNIIIALVCSSPILLGWIAGGMKHNWILMLVLSIFFTHLAREIIKDVNDIEANNGIRVTLPIWLKSKKKAMYVAYIALLLAIGSLLVLNPVFSASMVAYGLFWLAVIQLLLIPFIIKLKGTQISPDAISISTAFILLSIVQLIFQ